jgi:hypothetical protein
LRTGGASSPGVHENLLTEPLAVSVFRAILVGLFRLTRIQVPLGQHSPVSLRRKPYCAARNRRRKFISMAFLQHGSRIPEFHQKRKLQVLGLRRDRNGAAIGVEV